MVNQSPLDSAFSQANAATPSLDQGFAQASETPAQQLPTTPPTPAAEAPKNLPTSGPVNVYNPEGNLVSIPAEHVEDALKQSYRLAEPEEIDKHFNDEKYGTPTQQAIAGIEGVGQGFAGPLSTGAERLLGVPAEDIRGREEANPWISGGGKAVGLGAGFLTGTGEAAVLGKVAEATSAAALGLNGAKGASILAKIGAHSVGEAASMAALQGGDEISKLITEDPNQSVGTAVANIGLASVLGAGTGAVFGTVAPAWKALVGSKVDQLAADFKGRMNWHMENPNPVEALTKELTDHYSGVTGMADEVYGAQGLKAQEIAKVMPEMSEKITNWADETTTKLDRAISKMEANPADYPEGLVDKLRGKVDAFKEAANPGVDTLTMRPTKDVTPGDIFNAAQDLKQQLQEWSKFNKAIVPLAEHDFRTAAKGLSFDMRTALEDSNVWGKAAERQKSINGAFKEYLPALKDFEKKFTTGLAGEKVIDPAKIQTYMNQLGKPNAELKREMLDNFLKASQKYQDVIAHTHANLGIDNPMQASSLAVANSTLEKLSPGAKLADTVVKKGLAQLSGDVLGAGVGGSLGHVVGAPGWGAVIGEHALGPFFASVMPALTKGVLEKVNNSAGLKAAVDYGIAVAKGEAAMNKGVKAVFKADASVLSENRMPSEGDRMKLDRRLKELQTQPEKMANTANDLNHYLPGHGVVASETAARAVNYLNSMRPNTDKAFPLSMARQPSSIETAKFNRQLNIAQQPLTVLESVKQGSVTAQDVTTLKTLYPGLYTRLSQKLTNEVMEQSNKGNLIPYRTRLAVAGFLGTPLDGTMTPQGIMGAQPTPMGTGAQAGGGGMGGKPKRGTASLGKLPDQFQTQDQAAEASRLKD